MLISNDEQYHVAIVVLDDIKKQMAELDNDRAWNDAKKTHYSILFDQNLRLDDEINRYQNMRKDDLICLKNEYIEFLARENDRCFSLMFAHSIKAPDEVIEEKKELRKKMKELEKIIYPERIINPV